MKITTRVSLAVLLALGFAACGGSSRAAKPTTGATTSTTRPAPVKFAANYLALIGPVNTAIDELNAADPKKAEPAAVVTSVTRAIATFDAAVLRVHWSGSSTPRDVRALVRAASAFVARLNTGQHVNASVLRTQLASSVKALSAAANIVRADLHLPLLKP
jgi:hypothetical protein